MIDTIIEGTNALKLIGGDDKYDKNGLLKVMDLPHRGRGYVATQDIEANTLIHVSDPLAMVVNQEWMPETCMGCFDFSYPKKMKIKALSTIEETRDLLQWWDQDTITTTTLLPALRHIAFCTDQCKYHSISTCSKEEWYTWLTCIYRLENYSPQHINNNNTTDTLDDDLDDPALILHDDKVLRIYLDKVWHNRTALMGSQDEVDNDMNQDDFDDSDRTMCRFIASCLVKRRNNNDTNHGFDTLWTMQDNELGHFRHFYQQQQRQQQQQQQQQPVLLSASSSTSTCSSSSSSSGTSTLTSISTAPTLLSSSQHKLDWKKNVPLPIQHTMLLYHHFVTAMTQPMTLHIKGGKSISIPPGLSQQDMTSDLFRAIYYREMANSFGLWEQSQSQQNHQQQQQQMDLRTAAAAVTDDLELLGFGIYPSAVYFNHSCESNAIKLRYKSKMHFYTRQHILKGEEVCISYGNVDASYTERQQRLLDHYYFTCACTRCRLEQQQQQ